jgi:hypothetical protein
MFLQLLSPFFNGEALSRQVKSRFLTFYEGIKIDGLVRSPSTGQVFIKIKILWSPNINE